MDEFSGREARLASETSLDSGILKLVAAYLQGLNLESNDQAQTKLLASALVSIEQGARTRRFDEERGLKH
jgi:hypothetical protein